MSDPFKTAAKSIFNTSIAVSGVYTDARQNNYAIKCIKRFKLIAEFPGWSAPLPESKIEIIILKGDFNVTVGDTISLGETESPDDSVVIPEVIDEGGANASERVVDFVDGGSARESGYNPGQVIYRIDGIVKENNYVITVSVIKTIVT